MLVGMFCYISMSYEYLGGVAIYDGDYTMRTRIQIIDYYWEDYRLLLAHDEEQTTEVGAR